MKKNYKHYSKTKIEEINAEVIATLERLFEAHGFPRSFDGALDGSLDGSGVSIKDELVPMNNVGLRLVVSNGERANPLDESPALLWWKIEAIPGFVLKYVKTNRDFIDCATEAWPRILALVDEINRRELKVLAPWGRFRFFPKELRYTE